MRLRLFPDLAHGDRRDGRHGELRAGGGERLSGGEFVERHDGFEGRELAFRADLVEARDEVGDLRRVGDPHGFQENGFEEDLLVDGIAEEIARAGDAFEETLDRSGRDCVCDASERFDLLRRFVEYGDSIVSEDAAEQDPAEPGDDLLEKRFEVFALIGEIVDVADDGGAVVVRDGVQEGFHLPGRGKSEKVERLFFGDAGFVAAEEGDELVEQGLRVAHAAVGRLGDDVDRFFGDPDVFGVGDHFEARGDGGGLNAAEVEPLAAGNDRGEDLVDLGGGEDELGVGGRLLDGLEEGVPRALGEHVNFVDDVDLVFGADGEVLDVLAEFARFFDLCVRGGVDLDHVHVRLVGDGAARFALAARFAVLGIFAVQRLGEDARRGGLADAARPDEEVGVGDAAGLHGILERARDMLLPDHIGEALRTPLSGDYLVRHSWFSFRWARGVTCARC